MIPSGQMRRGFTLVQLLVSLAIFAFLTGIALPAIQKNRQAADRMKCSNNLKEIMIAVHNCADTNGANLPPLAGHYPKPNLEKDNGYGTVLFHLLPYIEQDDLYKKSLDDDTKVYSVWNSGTYAARIKTYVCPADNSAKDGLFEGWLATTSYAASFEVFGDAEAEARLQAIHRFPAFVTDGTSNTIFFAERYQSCNGEPNGWGYSGDSIRAPGFNLFDFTYFQVTPSAKECVPGTPQSAHERGMNVGMGDGSSRFVNEKLSWSTWRAACTPNAGDLLGADW